jgi:hypothetical protein
MTTMRIGPAACVAALMSCTAGLGRAAEDVPASLSPPPGLQRAMQLKADGVQIYRCGHPKDADASSAPSWVFDAPRATLLDADGKPAARHYAGPTWEAPDGSRITGKVTARADASEPGAIAWLLLKAESAGTPGRFDRVRAVQRLFTSGGAAPAGACSRLGEALEVPYRAVYVFWAEPK